MSSNGNTYAEEEDDYIKIAESEDSDFMEFPKEEDGTVLLSTIKTQFPDAIGIKFKGSSGAWRAIREVDNVLASPKGGWGDNVYVLTVPESKKRKSVPVDDEDKCSKFAKTTITNPLLKDIAVIGLPFKITNEDLMEYFKKNYGELTYCAVKYDGSTGKSRGFAFIRFKDEDAASEALKGEHYMLGRKVELKQKKDKPMQIFIGRLPSGTTKECLEKYFSQYGELTDVYVPTPFRSFAFLTFASTEAGRACLQESHVLDGSRLNVMRRNLDKDRQQRNDNRRDFGDNLYKDKQQRNDDRRDFGGNKSNSSFGGGYNTKYNQRDQQNYQQTSNMLSQQPTQNDMASDLKNMLFQFLTSKD